MKEYPTIEYWNKGFFGEYCYAFEKLDGSNLRAGYSRKRGFHKFGTKGQMIDHTDPLLGKGVLLFQEKYAEKLTNIFKIAYRDVDKFTVFFEYFGEKSFAGWHDKNDNHKVVVFDIYSEDHKAFIPPKELINNFTQSDPRNSLTEHRIELPEIYYAGVYGRQLIHDVRVSDLAEGVVIKGGKRKVWMVKAKTNKWFDRLRALKGELALLQEINGDEEVLTNL